MALLPRQTSRTRPPREGAMRALVCREHAKDALDLQTLELNIDLLPLYCRRDDHIPVPISCDWICYRSHVSAKRIDQSRHIRVWRFELGSAH